MSNMLLDEKIYRNNNLFEKQEIVSEINNTKREYFNNKTAHEIFEEIVEKYPNKIAVVYKNKKLTYKQLNEKSNQIAKILREKGVEQDSIVGIMVDRSIEMAIGIMAILKAGGAYLPLDVDYPKERLEYMLEDSGTKIILTQSKLKEKIVFKGEIIDMDNPLLFEGNCSNLKHINKATDLIYIIYTSGSTGKPKGVMVTHRNVVRLVNNTNYIKFGEEDCILQTGSLVFDASTFEIWGTFLNGLTLYLCDKNTILNPNKLEKEIKKNKITIMWLTSPLFSQLAEENGEMFSGLKFLIVGGDVVSPKYIDKVRRICPNIQIINGYGPTENTTFSTTFLIDKHYDNIPIGKPIANSTAYVVDKSGELKPVGESGELWVGGDGVARGYLNKEELTKEKFISNPFGEGMVYKTGDLVKRLSDGNIEFLGRIDHQVKIRGFRMELGEIERQILKHEAIKEVVILVKEDNNTSKFLCAYFVAERLIKTKKIRQHINKDLPEYMVPSCFIQLEKMPLTINGKIDRKALPEPDETVVTSVEYIEPRNEIEETLSKIWSEVLGVSKIGIDDNFFDLGGHSLKASIIIGKIYKDIEVEISLSKIFEFPTIKSLGEYILKIDKTDSLNIEIVKEQKYYPVSSVQKRMFILEEMTKEETSYNIPQAFEIKGYVDKVRLENVFKLLVERHEAFRTSFEMNNGEPVQIVNKDVDFKIEYMDGREEEIKEIIKSFIRPFDLRKAPLLRVTLIKINEDKHILLMDVHHIVFDGTSLSIFVKEFADLYEGKELEDLKLTYKDFSVWQNKWFESDKIKEQKKYWTNRLGGEIPVLSMPTDYARPVTQSFEGNRIYFQLEKTLTQKLKKLVNNTKSTLYIALMAAYNVMLSKYTNQEDIIVGTPVAARPHEEFKNIIGMFVNTVPMRNYPVNKKPFIEFLEEVKNNALEVYENGDYPLEYIVDELDIQRDPSRNLIFDTVFVMQNMDNIQLESRSLEIEPYTFENKTSKFDITLEAIEKEEKINFCLEYCTKLFKEETMELCSKHFIHIIEQIVENPEILLGEIEFVTQKEKENILFNFNNTFIQYPRNKTVHEIFEEMVNINKDKIAVGYEEKKLTYEELNKKANQLARKLRKKGVKQDSVVGIIVDRSVEMAIGIMAILKAGGAYLPLDVDYPEERLKYMLEDSQTKIILTQSKLKEKIFFHGDVVDIEDESLYKGDCSNLQHINKPSDLIYIIYTSGSTGKPKGVMVTHRNVVRLVKNTKYINFEQEDNILQTGSVVFDASTFEIWGALLNGLSLYLCHKNTILNATTLEKEIKKNKITIMWLTSPLFSQLAEEKAEIFDGLNSLIVGGDVVSPKYCDKVRKCCPSIQIINGYGPTENTTFSTTFLIDDNYDNIPIGKPITNSTAYIVGKSDKLQPVGVFGELWVGGDGVARGYLNKEDMTKEKFIPNPFGEGMIYKTGDLVRWLSDGNIEFLGRVDHQVKIRGFRMELAEIEKQILKHNAIKETIILVKGDTNANKSLCAYFVAERSIKVQEIREHINKDLPEYMIPSCFVQLEKMPLNTNGKINRKALPEPDKDMYNIENYAAPRNEIEEKFAEVWGSVLGVDKVGINHNFFDLGGHSLKAAVIVSKLQKDFEIGMNDIFKYPTIAQLSNHINVKKNNFKIRFQKIKEIISEKEKEVMNNIDIEREIKLYNDKNRRYNSINFTEQNQYKNILLTGSTGYLGIYLLKNLLEKKESQIYVLVRGNTVEAAQERLIKKMGYHFNSDMYKKYKDRIHILNGDLTKDKFDLSLEVYNKLTKIIDCIIHPAASVKHYGLYEEFYEINVRATERLLKFAETSKIKDFQHVSTLSVAMGDIENKKKVVFTEYDCDMNQNSNNLYAKTKFEAEKLILNARERGISSNIFRIGNIVFDSNTGKFQENIESNAFYTLIKSYEKLGIVPITKEEDTDFSFVDYVSKAIVALFDRKRIVNETFHIHNTNCVRLSDVLSNEKYNLNIKAVGFNTFIDYLKDNFDREGVTTYIQNIMLHYGWLDENLSRVNGTEYIICSDKTNLVLNKLGFQWPQLSENHIIKMLQHCKKVSFL